MIEVLTGQNDPPQKEVNAHRLVVAFVKVILTKSCNDRRLTSSAVPHEDNLQLMLSQRTVVVGVRHFLLSNESHYAQVTPC